jgi:hypothetical protein
LGEVWGHVSSVWAGRAHGVVGGGWGGTAAIATTKVAGRYASTQGAVGGDCWGLGGHGSGWAAVRRAGGSSKT